MAKQIKLIFAKKANLAKRKIEFFIKILFFGHNFNVISL